MFSLDSYHLWLYIATICFDFICFHMISWYNPLRLRFLLVSPRRWGRRKRNGRNSATRWRTCCARLRRPSSHATLHRSCRPCGTWGGWNWGKPMEKLWKNLWKTIFYHILWEKPWKNYGYPVDFTLNQPSGINQYWEPWMWRKQCHKHPPSHHHFYRWYVYHSHMGGLLLFCPH